MNWKEINADLQKGTLAPVYFMHGEEEYVKSETVKRIREAILPEGMEALNETVLPATVTALQLIEAAETLPMFCDKRLVIIKDWALFASGRSKDENENAKVLREWLPKAPETCVVLIYMRGKCEKKLDSYCKAGMREVLFSYLEGTDLDRWLQKRCTGLGVKIGTDGLECLIQQAGADLTRLSGELEKLAGYVGKGGTIGEKEVRALVTPTPESTVFSMIDALLSGDYVGACEKEDILLLNGETRTFILYMITRQIRQLCITKEIIEAGGNADKVASVLSVRSYGAKRLIEQARKTTKSVLETAYTRCVDADYAIKSGSVWEEAALDRIMLTLHADFRRKS